MSNLYKCKIHIKGLFLSLKEEKPVLGSRDRTVDSILIPLGEGSQFRPPEPVLKGQYGGNMPIALPKDVETRSSLKLMI